MPSDELNRKLLTLLREDARAKYAELGRSVHLSPPAVFERVKKLEKSGTILRYTVDLDPPPIDAAVISTASRLLDRAAINALGLGRKSGGKRGKKVEPTPRG